MIILYGGSFNPPTIAHFEIARYLIERYQPNQFIFVPVGSYYNKSDVASFHHRYCMIEILAKQLQNAVVSDFEESMTQFKGTITTLDYFQSVFPDEELFFVLGADNLLTLDRWIRIEEMLQKYRFIVLNRNQLDVTHIISTNPVLKNYQKQFIIESKLPNINLSATMYRKAFCDDVVMKEVNDYIYKHKLYNRGVI